MYLVGNFYVKLRKMGVYSRPRPNSQFRRLREGEIRKKFTGALHFLIFHVRDIRRKRGVVHQMGAIHREIQRRGYAGIRPTRSNPYWKLIKFSSIN